MGKEAGIFERRWLNLPLRLKGLVVTMLPVIALLGFSAAFVAVELQYRNAGIWINDRKITLNGMPGYYFVASTGPLGKIASEDTLERYQIGLDNVAPQRTPRGLLKGLPWAWIALSALAILVWSAGIAWLA